jgi:ATP-dependent DNA ligase
MLDLSDVKPMLAKSVPGSTPVELIARLERQGYFFESKLDGHRCIIRKDGDRVTLLSRNGDRLTSKFPEVVDAVKLLDADDLVLDGELVCLDEMGRPDLSGLQRRASASRSYRALAAVLPAQFVAFDCLGFSRVLYGEFTDLRNTAYLNRRAVLTAEVPSSGVVSSVYVTQSGSALWAAVREMGWEGLVAKHPDARYSAGRSADWVKVKRRRRMTAWVTDMEVGKGHRASSFGALVLSLCRDGRWVEVGKVGTGFSRWDLQQVQRHILGGAPLLVEIEFMGVRDGELREPVFIGIRTDVDRDACTWNQLERS